MRRTLCVGLATLLWSSMSFAQSPIDIHAYFQKARDLGREGLARKTKTVDARAARPGEIVVTVIKGEGKETQSPPAKTGDMVVRNRCPETGSEEFLVPASKFAGRYEGPAGSAGEGGWRPYRPRGADMRFVVVTERDGAFTFTAPWGETMIARPGDAIVQDIHDPKDTYRVQKAAFACTYEEIRRPAK
ncbi:MAG TPA: hypothetical protein VKR62_18620 [Roseiarcus sp.]|nr:hypothetical protein [Roseiarcus sp.]